MAYTLPRTWAIGESPTAAMLNQEIRDNLSSLRAMNDVAIRVHRTAVQSMPNNTRQPISWQAQTYQTGVTWSSGSNPSRLTVPITGWYLLAANVKFANVVGGSRAVGWRINGVGNNADLQFHPGNGVDTVNGVELIFLTAGQYLEVFGFQNTGSSLNTAGTTEGDVWAHLSLVATGTAAPLWKPPRTWADGFPQGILSPALLNTHIRDEVTTLRLFRGAGAKVWLSEDQSISPDQRGVITWDSSDMNVGNIWDGGSKFVAPVDGVYLILMDIEWADSGLAGVQGIGFAINDSSTGHRLQYQQGTTNGENQSGGDLVALKKDDFLELFAFQDSPESLSLHGGTNDRTRASVTLWAATS